MNDLSLQPFFGELFQFADDSSIIYECTNIEQLSTFMEHDFRLLEQYMRANGISINVSKTQVMKFCTKRSNHGILEVDLGGVRCLESSSVNFLGLTLDTNLDWSEHVDKLTKKLSSACGMMYKLRTKLDKSNKLLLYQSLAESHLRYLNIVWAWKSSESLKTLSVVQNKLLKNVFGLQLRFPTRCLYKIKEGILPVRAMNIYQRSMYVYKALKDPAPGMIIANIIQHSHDTRNRGQPDISVYRLYLCTQSMSSHGVSTFHRLPSNLRNIERISSFKKELIKLLQSEQYLSEVI